MGEVPYIWAEPGVELCVKMSDLKDGVGGDVLVEPYGLRGYMVVWEVRTVDLIESPIAVPCRAASDGCTSERDHQSIANARRPTDVGDPW